MKKSVYRATHIPDPLQVLNKEEIVKHVEESLEMLNVETKPTVKGVKKGKKEVKND